MSSPVWEAWIEIAMIGWVGNVIGASSPVWEAWIEMPIGCSARDSISVVSRMGGVD